MKKSLDFVIICLVYRNMNDLIEFIESVEHTISNYKIIIVNSFFDKESDELAGKIAQKYDCDFLSVENKGYSYGNNMGIQFARDNYKFKYAIISNPDIIVKNFQFDFEQYKYIDIIAPKIIAATGKLQNPMVVKENKLAEKLVYLGFKKSNRLSTLFGISLYKINRVIFEFFNKKDITPIYMAHGSFLIIKYDVLNLFDFKPYDENIFLFAEESILALKAAKNNLVTAYITSIVVNHKEDGSMKLGNFSINSELSKANIYYYENYRMKRKYGDEI